MLCQNCGHDNPPQTSFCVKCATKLTPKLASKQRIYTVPQDDFAAPPARPSSSSNLLLETLSWLLFLAAVLWLSWRFWV